jgi:hypothetical protein
MTKRGRGSSGALVVLVMRAPLVKRVGAIEVPPGTRARRTTSLFAPSVAVRRCPVLVVTEGQRPQAA